MRRICSSTVAGERLGSRGAGNLECGERSPARKDYSRIGYQSLLQESRRYLGWYPPSCISRMSTVDGLKGCQSW